MNAVICALNAKYIHSSPAPWCLLAGIRAFGENGVTAHVVEGTINEKIEDVAERICARKPQAVGFCCYIWNITATLRLVRSVKERLPQIAVILGGPEVGFRAGQILRENPEVLAVISGEGESPFAQLLNAVYYGSPVQGIPGVTCRNGEKIVSAPPVLRTDDPPRPYTADYLRALHGRIAYLESSRGCPFSCAFCLSGRSGGLRFFDLEQTKRELLLLANSGTKTVKFVDRTFNANRGRALELFTFILRHYGKDIPHGVCFHFEIAGDLLDDETIGLLSTAPAGAVQLEIGLQSFHTRTLEAVNRKTDLEKLKCNIRRLIAPGNIHIHIDLIAGLPYEGWDSFADSFNTAYFLHPHMLQLGFLKLLYGAAMREHPGQFPCRYSPQPPYEIEETPWLSPEELNRLHHTEDALERLYNSGRFRRTLCYLLERMKCGPFPLLTRFGDFCAAQNVRGISLDDYSALVFRFFSVQEKIDPAALCDRMVCDRIATNPSGKLPPVLCVRDSRLKTFIRTWERQHPPRKGVKRRYALLSSEKCVVYADYRNRNPVTGDYLLVKVPLNMLKIES